MITSLVEKFIPHLSNDDHQQLISSSHQLVNEKIVIVKLCYNGSTNGLAIKLQQNCCIPTMHDFLWICLLSLWRLEL